jgi:hypothetical protein
MEYNIWVFKTLFIIISLLVKVILSFKKGVEIIFLFFLLIGLVLIIAGVCICSNIYLLSTKRRQFVLSNYPFYNRICFCLPFEFIYHWIYRNCLVPLCSFYSKEKNIGLFAEKDCYLPDDFFNKGINGSCTCPSAVCGFKGLIFCFLKTQLLNAWCCLKIDSSQGHLKYYCLFFIGFIAGNIIFYFRCFGVDIFVAYYFGFDYYFYHFGDLCYNLFIYILFNNNLY